ncbi:MAG: hypothetical protein GY745_17415 [Actinomycetia bacterium]|nr:hypothetical protein [Actinomycetes bacterium]MCP4086810.1 hypothetical protein [Actinomycetes bacterium]
MPRPTLPPRSASERRRSVAATQRLSDLIALTAVWGAGLLVLAVAALQNQVPVSELLHDPATVAGGMWYVGLISNLGAIGWTVAVTAAAGAAYVARVGGRPQATISFLQGGALVGAMLLVDDLFQVHQRMVPREVGLSKPMVLLIELVLAGGWAIISYPELKRTRWHLLVMTGGAFMVSLVIDQLVAGAESGTRMLVEDGAKFLGVLAWALYCVRTAADIVASIARRAVTVTTALSEGQSSPARPEPQSR